ncbi:MAG: hypothetical protein AB1773_06440 [Pseudomonadota bacterium]
MKTKNAFEELRQLWKGPCRVPLWDMKAKNMPEEPQQRSCSAS